MPPTVSIVDLSPRFLKFYEAAQGAGADRRWQLWHEHYHFAAVPPTEEGMRMARQLLDASWDRYPSAIEVIRAGASGYSPAPQESLDAVCRVLGFDGDLAVKCVLFVGNFEGNAFAYTDNGVPIVHFPVEGGSTGRNVVMAHEFAHVVHDRLSGWQGGYVMPIGRLALMEGIAMWTSKEVVPGHDDGAYLMEFTPGWLERCRANHREILAGIRPVLAQQSEELMWRYTMGEGATGTHREVYWAGWHAVGHLLREGHTLAELARAPVEKVPGLVDAAVSALLA